MKSQSEFDIGSHVRMWRKARGLLQKELAAKASMNVTQLWALENGRFSPSIKNTERIANALDITLLELLSSPGELDNSPDGTVDEKNRLHTPICEIMPVLKSSDGIPGIDTRTQ
ncbi:MAG: helix-turn-helix transcriptional regulator, partial [Kiritimatiellae bacterium]|nr:helix-turn-helix transcriptional regulator [Kiritimatiellia bacterium]